MRHNVGIIERAVSLAAGGVALAAARRIPAALKLPLALGGAALLFRGAGGWCPVNAALGRGAGLDLSSRPSAADVVSDREAARVVHAQHRATWMERRDLVEEASDESFPASDPPSFTPGHA